MATSRLLLRTATATELKIAYAAASDEEAQRWLGWEDESLVPRRERKRLLATRAGLGRSSIDWYEAYDPMTMVAIDPKRRRYAGTFTITPDTCEIGAYLSPSYRGQGLGTELFTSAHQLAHRHLGLTEIRAGTELGNNPCIRSLQSAGFTPAEGPSTHRLPDGRTIRSLWFSHSDPAGSTCPALQDHAMTSAKS